MKVLLMDTCGAQGSVAIADTDRDPCVAAIATMPGRSASERLVVEILRIAEESKIALAALDAVAVVSGPGSFTGVRVGVSAAKGLCEALDVPLIAISRLAVLASLAEATIDDRVWAVLDAGRGEFYCGEYLAATCCGEALVSQNELALLMQSHSGNRHVVVCEDAVAQALAHLAPKFVNEPDAAAVLPLALKRLERGQFDDVAHTDANYLRRTDQEIFAKMHARSAVAERDRP